MLTGNNLILIQLIMCTVVRIEYNIDSCSICHCLAAIIQVDVSSGSDKQKIAGEYLSYSYLWVGCEYSCRAYHCVCVCVCVCVAMYTHVSYVFVIFNVTFQR